jgi:phosphoglycerate dehydrogenase-like enzyme
MDGRSIFFRSPLRWRQRSIHIANRRGIAMTKPLVLLTHWVHDSVRERLLHHLPEAECIDARDSAVLEEILPRASVCYGAPPMPLLPRARVLRWIQLQWAGVSFELCDALRGSSIQLTNMAGLYGPTIAEHALGLMIGVARNFHRAMRQQHEHLWRRDLGESMVDLQGKTAAILGVGNIGQHIARLCQAFGMRVLGCRRSGLATACVDEMFPPSRLVDMLRPADFVVVAAPLTRETDGMLGQAEFAALKRGSFFINVSRGRIAREEVLVESLRSGQLAGAGLDVFSVEPLPKEHPLWTMPHVMITPHYSAEIINRSPQPGERFLRNLKAYLAGDGLQNVVDVARGY